MALLDDVATLLETDAVATGSTDWVIVKAFMPDSPDQVIAIFEAGGEPPDSDGGASVASDEHEFPAFVVQVRGEAFEYDVARAKMQDVFDSLHNGTVTNNVYTFSRGDTLPLPPDEQDRPIISQGFRCMRKQGT